MRVKTHAYFDGSSGGAAMKYWEIIARNLKKAGWSLGWVSALDLEGRTIWIADPHRDNGKRLLCVQMKS
jgi:hypothetical protein